MSKKLNALTMERRLACLRLAKIAGKEIPQAPASPKAKNGKPVLQANPMLSLKPQ